MNKGFVHSTPHVLLVLGIGLFGCVQAGQVPVAETGSHTVWKNTSGECWQAADGGPAWCGEIPDADGDGVPDDRDLCLDSPAGSAVGDDGCPLDSDRDGVPDIADSCPDTALGVRVDTRGCDLDLDGDGVPYYADRCWDTPKGVQVNDNGCPVKVVMRDVLFAVDKADLTLDARRFLNKVVENLQGPAGESRIVVEGHTDSTGTAAYNLRLSQARARAVKDYLVHQGVAATVTTVAKGESEPVADNRTAAGRAQNRRVEILFE